MGMNPWSSKVIGIISTVLFSSLTSAGTENGDETATTELPFDGSDLQTLSPGASMRYTVEFAVPRSTCDEIVLHDDSWNSVSQQIVAQIGHRLNLSATQVVVEKIRCGSLFVDFSLVATHVDYRPALASMTGSVELTVEGETFPATCVTAVITSKSSRRSYSHEMRSLGWIVSGVFLAVVLVTLVLTSWMTWLNRRHSNRRTVNFDKTTDLDAEAGSPAANIPRPRFQISRRTSQEVAEPSTTPVSERRPAPYFVEPNVITRKDQRRGQVNAAYSN